MTATISKKIRTRPSPAADGPATVTVVISCYNYGRFLRAAVLSAVSQDDVTVDVIIVDDASTDDSRDVAELLSAEHGNVRVLTHNTNRGVVETFNHGAKAARGEFLVRLDADDMLTPGSLGRSTRVARAYPSVGLVYGHPIHFSTNVLPPPRLLASAWTIWPGREWLTDRCRSGINVITSPEVLMRRSVLEEIGYQAPLRHTHDMELWFRLSAFADVAYIHGADQAWHREHSESLSAREVNVLVDLQERREAFDVLFAGPAGSIAEAGELRRCATRALVEEALKTARRELDRGAGQTDLFRSSRELARELAPGVVGTPAWTRLALRPGQTSRSARFTAAALARRMAARLRSELQWRRWHRTGVY
ncbi:glycosyltransferase family 2 protein [Arthrobacter sp. H16F315]|uniref:glycosyltransferase family 2 protein n=1 Tax=Arthrobacter sp. H16F315 TaxID=2955314 RepID=UPI002096CAEF|nr:glycosyltransferase family 2 protein [Arthrobacter sp. H16F315]